MTRKHTKAHTLQRNRSQATPNTVRLLRDLAQQPGHGGRLACGYGVHDFVQDKPYEGYKECTRCGATYGNERLVERLSAPSTSEAQ